MLGVGETHEWSTRLFLSREQASLSFRRNDRVGMSKRSVYRTLLVGICLAAALVVWIYRDPAPPSDVPTGNQKSLGDRRYRLSTFTPPKLPSIPNSESEPVEGGSVITVVSEAEGNYVHDCDVFLEVGPWSPFSKTEWMLLGNTREDGYFEVSERPSTVARLVAVAEGFARAIELWGGEDATLVLIREGTLEGVVVGPDGSPVGKGIRVVARAANRSALPKESVWAADQGYPAINSTFTDENGHFQIGQLSSHEYYRVFAAGGEFSQQPGGEITAYPAEGRFLQVPVGRVFGAILRFFADDRTPISVESYPIDGSWIDWQPSLSKFAVLPFRSTQYNLLRDQLGIPTDAEYPHVMPILCIDQGEGLDVASLDVSVRRPGFQEYEEKVPLGFALQDLEIHDIYLEPASEMGVIAVSLNWEVDNATKETHASGEPLQYDGYVVAKRDGTPHTFTPVSRRQSSVEFELPTGEYELTFLGATGWTEIPSNAGVIELTTDGARASFDFKELGSVALHVDEGLGQPGMSIQARLIRANTDASAFSFDFVPGQMSRTVALLPGTSRLVTSMEPGEYIIDTTFFLDDGASGLIVQKAEQYQVSVASNDTTSVLVAEIVE